QRLVRDPEFSSTSLPKRKRSSKTKSPFKSSNTETSSMANLEDKLKELTTAVASMSAAFQALRTKVNEMEATMALKGIDPALFPTVFPLSLEPICSQMVNTPPESKIVKIFIANLQPKYHNHLRCMGLETFDKVFHIGIDIEDDLLQESSKTTRTVFAVQTTDRPFRRLKREYTPLGMTYTQAFDCHKSQGLISPIGPTPDPAPENRSLRWDLAKCCKYRQGKGHSTEECFKLKYLLQDMVEDGRLLIPPSAKKPNTRTNPLTTLYIHTEEAPFNPTALITQIGQPIPNIVVFEDTFVNGIWASDDEDEYIVDCSHTTHHSVVEEDETANEATKDDAYE
ncbi:Phosphatidylinositol 3-kinase VPS34, partial [Bienertia sinuspersici]